MKPWHDCPACDHCTGPLSAHAPAGFYPGKRLRCMACGKQSVGTDADVERASRADLAWDAKCLEVR